MYGNSRDIVQFCGTVKNNPCRRRNPISFSDKDYHIGTEAHRAVQRSEITTDGDPLPSTAWLLSGDLGAEGVQADIYVLIASVYLVDVADHAGALG